MTAEQTLLWDVTPKRPAPSARTVEQHTEPGSKRNDPLPSFLAAESLKSSGEWRRRLREQLAASGDTLTRKFLAGLHPGGGGAK